MTIEYMLRMRTGTLAFFPGLSIATTLGHTPILLDALSVCSATADSIPLSFLTKPETVTVSNSCNSSLILLVDRTRPPKIVSEYDQEIPQSQTADYPVAPRGRAAQPSRDARKTN